MLKKGKKEREPLTGKTSSNCAGKNVRLCSIAKPPGGSLSKDLMKDL